MSLTVTSVLHVTGINRKNRSSLKYPDLQSARRPVAHCDEVPVPGSGELPDKDGGCFTSLRQTFPGTTIEELKAGISYGPQIRQLIIDPHFENSMNEVELEA